MIFSKDVFGTAVVGLPDPKGILLQSGSPNCNYFMHASFKNQYPLLVRISVK